MPGNQNPLFNLNFSKPCLKHISVLTIDINKWIYFFKSNGEVLLSGEQISVDKQITLYKFHWRVRISITKTYILIKVKRDNRLLPEYICWEQKLIKNYAHKLGPNEKQHLCMSKGRKWNQYLGTHAWNEGQTCKKGCLCGCQSTSY